MMSLGFLSQKVVRQAVSGATLLLAVALTACSGLPLSPSPTGDIRTVSDQSEAERRARVRLELASAYFAQGQLETALDELKQALAIFPNLADGLNLRGLIYAGLMQTQLAEDSFQRALALSPNDGNILHNLGWFQCQRGQYAQAQQAFSRALSQPLYRDASKTLLAQGVCQAMGGQVDQGIATLTSAYERDPGNPALGANLAEMLARRGQFDRAAFYIRRVNQQPAWVTAQSLWLGARIERRLGQTDAAAYLIQQLRTRFPNAPEALAAERGALDEGGFR
jgi:type IV pilus assembly protein PilF